LTCDLKMLENNFADVGVLRVGGGGGGGGGQCGQSRRRGGGGGGNLYPWRYNTQLRRSQRVDFTCE